MRWLVEVTSLGKIDSESLQLEADNWQKALEGARARRGENASMNGFSVDVNDQGCRAVDAVTRFRYDVRQIADPADGSARASQGAPEAEPVGAAAGVPRPSPKPTSASPAPPVEKPAENDLSARASAAASFPPQESRGDFSTTDAARPFQGASPFAEDGTGADALSPRAPSWAPPPSAAGAATPLAGPEVLPPHSHVTSQPAAAASQPPPSSRTTDAAGMPVQVVFKREQERTQALPLTYREYVYVVPANTTEEDAQALLHHQLELVQTSLHRMPAGKLVNLAVFDAQFQGKPQGTPLATLTWKDWRGAPVISAPRREAQARAAGTGQRVNGRAAEVHAVMPAPEAIAKTAAPRGSVPPPAAIASAPTPAPLPAAHEAARDIPPTEKSYTAAPVFAAKPVVEIQAVAVPAPPPPAPPVEPKPAAVPTLQSVQTARMRGDDLIADLFEVMHDLHFLRDALEGGDFCLTVGMEKIPCQAGLVHLYDIDRREFVITSTRGASASSLLLKRHGEGEKLLAGAMRRRRAIVITDATEGDAASVERYVAIGGARSVIVAPVMQAGRFLGAIELLNPLDGSPFTSSDGDAIGYIAAQFAEFVASRGPVTDTERIGARRPRG